MNSYIFLVLFFIIYLTYSVACDDAAEVKRLGLTRARQYRYNHPPEPENYENIPVAVVYDKVIGRQNRQRNVKPTKETDDVTSIPKTKSTPEVTTIPNIKTADNLTTDISVKVDVISQKNTVKPELREIKLEYKIPVSVVYDEEPGTVRRNRIKSGVSTRIRKPIRKQEMLTSESTERSKPIINTDNANTESSYSNNQENSYKKLKQEQRPETKVSGSKQKDDFKDQENFSQISDTKTNSERETTPKKRINGDPDPIVPIVTSENRVFGHNGEFKYSYEGGDGTKAFSKGQLKTFDEEVAGEAVEGGFSYKDKEGNDFSLSYTADENGYRPVGAHLPTPPPIPPAIARALAYLATKTTPEPVTEPYEYEENTPVPK